MTATDDPLDFKDRAAWREWLQQRNSAASEAWLVIQKKHSRLPGLCLAEAVEEALCFGWIDGQLRRLDDERYLLRFSPRRADSIWSVINIRRVEKLTRAGRMTEAGLKKVAAAEESGQWQAAFEREDTETIPPDLERALRRHKAALAAYRALPASQKKQFIFWLQTAKTEPTRNRRIAEIIRRVLGD